MISAIEWVPEGVADPNPKKYEFSAAELELIEMMEKQQFGDDEEQPPVAPKPKKKKKETSKPKIEHNLPADLRMDEYSSDEDENDAVQGTTIGNLLVDPTGMVEAEEEIVIPVETVADVEEDDMDSDSDDDLNDVPDTREYTPLDMDGMNALGLSHVGTNAPAYMDINDNGEDEDDASDIEDVQIQPGDAIIVVAKTEEVRSMQLKMYLCRFLGVHSCTLSPKGFCHFGSQCVRTEDRKPLCAPRHSAPSVPIVFSSWRH